MPKPPDKPFISATERRVNRKDGPVGSINGKPMFAIPYAQLPRGAKRVIDSIARGQNPTGERVFNNHQGNLPTGRPLREFDVPSPGRPVKNPDGSPNRGKRRVTIRDNGTIFFTPAHHDRIPKHVKGRANPKRADITAKLPRDWQHGTYVVTGLSAAKRKKVAQQMKSTNPPLKPIPRHKSLVVANSPPISRQQGVRMAKPISGHFNTTAPPKKPVALTSTFNKAAAKPAQSSPPPKGPEPVLKPKGAPGLGGPGVASSAKPVAPVRKAPPDRAPAKLAPAFNPPARGPKR